MGAFGLNKNKVEINQKETISGEQVHSLSISTSSADIEVSPATGDDILVLLSGEMSEKLAERYEFKVSQQANTLDISFNLISKNTAFQFGAGYSDVKLKVALPEKMYEDIQTGTSSGDIILSTLVSKAVSSTSSSGDQIISGLNVRNRLFVKSSSGTITVNGNNAGNAIFHASSGSIKLKELVSSDATMETSSGDIIYQTESITGNLNFKASSGNVDIQVNKVQETLSLECKANSGNVNVQIDGLEFKEKGEHHAVANLGVGENSIIARTSSGDITIY